MSEFFRFPHTPHIAWLASGSPRDDKVLSLEDAEILLAGEVVIEEKIDGANLGFSIGSDGSLCVQNRGQYLLPPFTGQFAQLGKWLELHQDRLLDELTESLIVFGEWCAARHSLNYDQLPDWWLMFDVYEREANPRCQNSCRLRSSAGYPHRSDISCTENLIHTTPPNSKSRHCSKRGIAARVHF